jgi:PAS domain S-box-containing protein
MPTLDHPDRGDPGARTVAEKLATHLDRLQAVTAALSQALTTDQVADVIVAHVPGLLDATGCALALRTEDGTEFAALCSTGSLAKLVAPGRRIPTDIPNPFADAWRGGSAVILRSPEECHVRYPHLSAPPGSPGDWPLVVVPLAQGGVAGGLSLCFPAGRAFGDEDWAVISVVAGLCAQALECARLQAAERQAREDGQRVVEERQRTDAALRRSEAWFRRIVETAAEGVWVIDAESRTQYVNGRMGDMLGIAAADMLGRFPSDFLFTEDQEEARNLFRLKRQGDDRPFDFRLRRPDGAAIWCRIANRPLFSDDGQFLGVLGLFSDISDRKRLEEAVRLSERHYRTLADAVPGIVFTSQPDGSCDYCNQWWYEYTGLAKEETLGYGCRSAIHPEDLAHVEARWGAAARAGEPWVCQYRLRHGGGGYRWFLGRSVPLRDEGGRVVKWFGIATDIDDQKHLEAAMNEADRQKNDFLAMLGHELRNPLAPLRNGVYLLQDESLRHASTARQVVAMMERQVQHLVRMVDDLLDVSRISRGTIDLRREPQDLAGVIAQAVETCRPFLEARGHQLTVSLPPEPLLLEADPTRLVQVFANLLNNSAKYTPQGGHIAIAAANEGKEVVVRVRDDGAGLPDHLLPSKIFEPLTQATRTLARSEGGLGIGLTLVRKLVELHGGSVEAHSQGPDQGSEFVVRLPAASRALPLNSPDGARAVGDAATQCRRVLLVEDRRDVADSLALLLGARGHEVRVAYDGPEALEAAGAFRPDAVLLDIGLPGLDGLEVARRLRQEPGLEGVLLVTLSGYGTEEDHRRSRESGCDAHLVKPVDPDVLFGVLAAGR